MFLQFTELCTPVRGSVKEAYSLSREHYSEVTEVTLNGTYVAFSVQNGRRYIVPFKHGFNARDLFIRIRNGMRTGDDSAVLRMPCFLHSINGTPADLPDNETISLVLEETEKKSSFIEWKVTDSAHAADD